MDRRQALKTAALTATSFLAPTLAKASPADDRIQKYLEYAKLARSPERLNPIRDFVCQIPLPDHLFNDPFNSLVSGFEVGGILIQLCVMGDVFKEVDPKVLEMTRHTLPPQYTAMPAADVHKVYNSAGQCEYQQMIGNNTPDPTLVGTTKNRPGILRFHPNKISHLTLSERHEDPKHPYGYKNSFLNIPKSQWVQFTRYIKWQMEMFCAKVTYNSEKNV